MLVARHIEASLPLKTIRLSLDEPTEYCAGDSAARAEVRLRVKVLCAYVSRFDWLEKLRNPLSGAAVRLRLRSLLTLVG